jgi:hypothetical protein
VRGAEADLPADLPAGVQVHTRPLDLAAALPRVRLAIHHGGLGLAYACALAATPQVLLTERLEHQITARALVDLGAANTYDSTQVGSACDLMGDFVDLTAEGGGNAARLVADELPRACGEQVLDQIVERINRVFTFS